MKQEFVTLPREVVKLALESMDESYADTRQGRALADVLRAALEQPQVVRETAPDGATHIQPQQGAFYKRVDEKWYVWSRMEDGRPHRWYISPGTVESCLKPISAATERLQNHVPDAGNMVPAGWKLVPLEPTVVEQPPTADDSSEVEQPQVEQEICCKIWSVNRIDDLGKIVDSSGRLIATVYGSQADKIVACHNSYTQQRHEREPLTDEEIDACFPVQWEGDFYQHWRKTVARAIEASHGIK